MTNNYWLGLSVTDADYTEYYDYVILETSERLSGTRSGTASGWLSFSFQSLLDLYQHLSSQEANDYNYFKHFARAVSRDQWIEEIGVLDLDEMQSDVPRGSEYEHTLVNAEIDLAGNIAEISIWRGEQGDYIDNDRVICAASGNYGYFQLEKAGVQFAEDIDEAAMKAVLLSALEEFL